MKKILISITFATFLSSLTSVAYACNVSVAKMNWASGEILTSVAAFIIENGYSCTVTVVPSTTVTAITSLAENNKPDLIPELWVNSAPLFFKLKQEGKVKIASSSFSNGGEEGWWVPEYLVKKYPQLQTIDGILANPQLVGSVFHNCPVGWGCRIANDNYVKAYDFKKNGMKIYNHGSGETLKTSIASAYKDKKPWFGYYWGPTAVLGKYPMVKVDVGAVNAEIHSCMQQEVCKNMGKSAYAPANVYNVVTTRFATDYPRLYALVSQMTFDNEIISKVLAWKEDNKASGDEAAVYFLTNYKDAWGNWLDDKARKKLVKLL